MNVITLQYDDLEEKIFSILAKAHGPILIQKIANDLNQPAELIAETLDKMVMNGAPLKFSDGGRAVGY